MIVMRVIEGECVMIAKLLNLVAFLCGGIVFGMAYEQRRFSFIVVGTIIVAANGLQLIYRLWKTRGE